MGCILSSQLVNNEHIQMQLKETLKAMSHKHKSLNQAYVTLCTNL